MENREISKECLRGPYEAKPENFTIFCGVCVRTYLQSEMYRYMYTYRYFERNSNVTKIATTGITKATLRQTFKHSRLRVVISVPIMSHDMTCLGAIPILRNIGIAPKHVISCDIIGTEITTRRRECLKV